MSNVHVLFHYVICKGHGKLTRRAALATPPTLNPSLRIYVHRPAAYHPSIECVYCHGGRVFPVGCTRQQISGGHGLCTWKGQQRRNMFIAHQSHAACMYREPQRGQG